MQIYTEVLYYPIPPSLDSCPVTCQRIFVTQKLLMGCRTVLLFCDIHIDVGMTLNLLQPLRVICGCIAIQINSAETSLALLAM